MYWLWRGGPYEGFHWKKESVGDLSMPGRGGVKLRSRSFRSGGNRGERGGPTKDNIKARRTHRNGTTSPPSKKGGQMGKGGIGEFGRKER